MGQERTKASKTVIVFGIQYVWADCMCACVGLTQVAVGKGFGEWP